MPKMSSLFIVAAKEAGKLDKTKWCVFCGTPFIKLEEDLQNNTEYFFSKLGCFHNLIIKKWTKRFSLAKGTLLY